MTACSIALGFNIQGGKSGQHRVACFLTGRYRDER